MRINTLDKIRLSFHPERKLYFDFYHILGFFPHKLHLYKQAFLHKSFLKKDTRGHLVNNERLEYLGDAMISAVVGDILYHHFPEQQEGFLTQLRSRLVSRHSLNELGIRLQLDRFLRYHGDMQHAPSMIGNAFEALMGAVYLDYGYRGCMLFMRRLIRKGYLDLQEMVQHDDNYKSKLLEWAQQRGYKVEFSLMAHWQKADGTFMFKSQVLIEGHPFGIGLGTNKKDSQQLASKYTLKTIARNGYRIENLLPQPAETSAQ